MTRAVVLLLVCAPFAARADETEALLHEGVVLRREGKDEEALVRFRRARDSGGGARALAQIALAEQALGRWVPADADLRAALATDDPWIARNRSYLESAREVIAGHLGELEVIGPAGAELFVDGTRVAMLPLDTPLRLGSGRITVEVRLAGHVAAMREVDVPARGLARETVPLAPLPAPTTAPPPIAQAPPVAQTPLRAAARASASLAQRPLRLAGWATLGGGIATLAAGAIATGIRENAAKQWNDDSRCLSTGKTRYQTCGAYYDTATAAEKAAIAGYTIGGALAVTSTVLMIVDYRRARARPRAFAGCGPGPAIGISCGASL
jgi:hypothetical protein